MDEILKQHDLKIKYLLGHIDDLSLGTKNQGIQMSAYDDTAIKMSLLSKQQQQEILAMQQQVVKQHADIVKFSTALDLAASEAERLVAKHQSALNLRTVLLILFAVMLLVVNQHI